MATAYLGLGANLGDRKANLIEALRLLEPEAHVEAVSALYASPPQPPSPPPDYLNAACRVTTDLSPEELLRHVKAIERKIGRTPAARWAPRVIDIDILLYDALVLATPGLTIPHPRILERAFVLRPLLDLDPTLVHPVMKQGLSAALESLAGQEISVAEAVGWDRDDV